MLGDGNFCLTQLRGTYIDPNETRFSRFFQSWALEHNVGENPSVISLDMRQDNDSALRNCEEFQSDLDYISRDAFTARH